MDENDKIIKELKQLYNQNVDFITSLKNGTFSKHYSNKTIAEYEKLNGQLNDYIEDIKFGLECDKDTNDWCEFFGDVLSEDDELDDDNFPRGGW